MNEAIILTAGLGTRLLPFTKIIPKPLFPVLERPLLSYIIEHTKKYGFNKFYMNLHHLPDLIEAYTKSCKWRNEVKFSYEKELLGTGGGLKRLLDLTDGNTVLVHNGDIYEEFDLNNAMLFHSKNNFDITWLLNKSRGNVLVYKNKVVKIGDENGLTFTGVSIWNKSMLKFMSNRAFNIIPVLSELIRKKDIRVGAYVVSNFFGDIGTPHGIFRVYSYMLHKQGKNVFIHNEASVSKTTLNGYVYIGKNVRIKDTMIKNAIILGNTVIEGETIENTIIFENMRKEFST